MLENLDCKPPLRPAESAETNLIGAILDGRFPIGASLPAERELAARLGVTRPTLREALQRLARDGWLEIRQGKPTRVRDYWQEGNLAVLGVIARQSENLPAEFVPNLLFVRQLLAPSYTRLAIEKLPQQIAQFLQGYLDLPDQPEAFVTADWKLHHQLTVASGNPIFTLIWNGFYDLYQSVGPTYFSSPHSRVNSRAFYSDLFQAALARDPDTAEALTRRVMRDSLMLWQTAIYKT